MSDQLFNEKVIDRLRVVLERRESTTGQWFCLHTGPGSSDPHWFTRTEIEQLVATLKKALAVDAKENVPCKVCGRIGSPLEAL
jgi:hypothetical protein